MLLYGRVERSKNMDLMDRIMELTEQGYCCAQILAILLLDTIGEEDPGYVRAMDGLLYGVGYSYGCCGCMTGGAAVLSYLTGRPYGEEGREYDAALHKEVLKEFTDWFTDEMKRDYGGINCSDIIRGSAARCLEYCPGIIAATYEECMEILDRHGLV